MYQQTSIGNVPDGARALAATASPDDAVVELKAVGLNDSDICPRRERACEKSHSPDMPATDGAGIVIAVGSAVKNLKPGDAVCLYPCLGCGACEYCGTDREYLCVQAGGIDCHSKFVRLPARNCFAIPAGLSFEQAAAFPTAFLTAWRLLVSVAEVKPGEWILIVDIGSGVTTAALQLAKYLGARIIVTSNSDEKLAKAKDLGAEFGIHCGDTDVAKEVRRRTAKRGVDVVLDCTGGAGWMKSFASLAKGGRLVTSGAADGATPSTDLRRIFWNNLKVFGSTLGSREEFRRVLSFLEVTRTQPTVDRIISVNPAAQGLEPLTDDSAFGKIVLHLEP